MVDEHRAEHARIALFIRHGDVPSDDDVNILLAEMDTLSASTGAISALDVLDHQAKINAENQTQAAGPQVTDTSNAQRLSDAVAARQAERIAAVQQLPPPPPPSDNLAFIPTTNTPAPPKRTKQEILDELAKIEDEEKTLGSDINQSGE